MFKELRNIEKREDGIYILNKLGHVAMIPIDLEDELYKYAKLKVLPENAPKFIYDLANIGLLEYTNYESNEEQL